MWQSALQLIALTFIRAHVAAASVLRVGTREAALIRLQQVTEAVGAATRVSGINGRTTREQRNSWRWPAVVPQRAEYGVYIVQVTGAIEVAAVIAAQVV